MGRGATLAELHVDRGDASSIAAALADVEHHHQQRARQYPAPQYPGASIPGMEQGKVKHSHHQRGRLPRLPCTLVERREQCRTG
jgi:hypothetical protein